jgi:hypothetical protein
VPWQIIDSEIDLLLIVIIDSLPKLPISKPISEVLPKELL